MQDRISCELWDKPVLRKHATEGVSQDQQSPQKEEEKCYQECSGKMSQFPSPCTHYISVEAET